MIEFNAFLTKAYELIAAEHSGEEPQAGVGVLEGRLITISKDVPQPGNVIDARAAFIESVVEIYGKAVSAEVEKLVNGEPGKPLSARTILAVGRLVAGSAGVVNRLGDILRRAAAADVVNVSAADVERFFAGRNLDDSRRFEFAELHAKLSTLQTAASGLMAEVGRHSAREVAEAMKDPGSDLATWIRQAVDIQMQFADALYDLDKLVEGDDAVEAAYTRACNRATELNRLANELSGLDAEALNKERYAETVAKLLPEQALEMHGNLDAVSAIEAKIAPLLVRVDAIKAGAKSGGTVNWEAAESVLKDIDAAKRAFAATAKDGIESGGGRWIPDAGFLAAVNGVFDRVAADIRTLAGDVAPKAVEALIREAYCHDFTGLKIFSELQKTIPYLIPSLANLREFAAKLAAVNAAANEALKRPIPEEDSNLAAAVDDAKRYIDDRRNSKSIQFALQWLSAAVKMVDGKPLDKKERGMMSPLELFMKTMNADDAKRTREALREFGDSGFKRIATSLTAIMPRIVDRCRLIRSTAGAAPMRELANDKLLMLALNGRLDTATVLGARAWGATEDMVDLDISDANLVKCRTLGSGTANEVMLCTYRLPDGTEKSYVFKSELEGESGLLHLHGAKEGYDKLQSIVHLNAASRECSELLGAPNAVVGAKVGSLRGRFGLFMEVAPGVSMGDMQSNPDGDYGNASLDRIVNLPKERLRKVTVNYMRSAIDLEWSDYLAGQTDRHWGNYLFKVGDDDSVEVHGIDNDLSFPAWRLGMTRFRLEGWHLEMFLGKMDAKSASADDVLEAFRTKFAKYIGEGRLFQLDGQAVIVNLEKGYELQETLRQILGFHSIARPALISQQMYDRLMAINGDIEGFRARLSKHLGPDAVEATVARLKEMVAHAEALKAKGRVLTDDMWGDDALMRKLVKRQDPGIMGSRRQFVVTGYYNQGMVVRDFLTNYRLTVNDVFPKNMAKP